jgi:hypothetical protein
MSPLFKSCLILCLQSFRAFYRKDSCSENSDENGHYDMRADNNIQLADEVEAHTILWVIQEQKVVFEADYKYKRRTNSFV